MSALKDFLTSVVAPILVGIVLALFDHWLDDRHNNHKH
ncbi:MAG: type I toxin-antitoxin system Fst family toxin [Lactobacillus johnsonii]|nr:type I toxin-antitoxin system Fst family toxin [Lactobacillus johnsonii]